LLILLRNWDPLATPPLSIWPPLFLQVSFPFQISISTISLYN
jgi:hypothetical protein